MNNKISLYFTVQHNYVSGLDWLPIYTSLLSVTAMHNVHVRVPCYYKIIVVPTRIIIKIVNVIANVKRLNSNSFIVTRVHS